MIKRSVFALASAMMLAVPLFSSAAVINSGVSAAVSPSVVSSSVPRILPGDNKPPAAIAPWCVDYTENLGIGSRGDDVLALQKELTLDGETVPATGYFGSITSAAVTAFQEKNAADVLTPLDLSRGTGYFGSSTRTMLNSVGESHCTIPNGGNNSSSTPTVESFSADPQSGSAPLTVQFVASAPQGSTLGNAVDFGDGTTGNLGVVPVCSSCNAEGMVSHTYVATGTYTASLTSGTCSCPANGVCGCPAILILATTTVVVGSASTTATSSIQQVNAPENVTLSSGGIAEIRNENAYFTLQSIASSSATIQITPVGCWNSFPSDPKPKIVCMLAQVPIPPQTLAVGQAYDSANYFITLTQLNSSTATFAVK